ncbi:MAG: class I SAM-dependent methyltransferase [Candidatus Thorarchaeota archaeon]|jgi:SAM-dependent methyltransferase
MSDWDQIFSEKGYVFNNPHADIERVVDILDNGESKRILDLGCGTGRHVLFFARLGYDVYGFDASPKALSMAQDWLQEENLTANLSKHLMEKPFPYGDDFFDGVVSIQVIHHNLMKDIKKTVSEIERVLKPNGLLFVTFPVLHLGPVEKERNWELAKIEEGTYIPQKGWECGIPHHYFTLEEIPDVFDSFEILDIFLDDTNHRCVLAKLGNS